ncbi:hypothetical protein [Kribbella deserti]|uniref:Uncharacterized protein n=1 Tax=Kribbella deserti TaxID=1926257 RepID=A0ABV6QI48_9ACTN
MSWAIYALRTAGGARRLDDIADDYAPPSLGTATEVIEQIREVAPDVDASNPKWLRISGPGHSVEVSIGKGVHVHDITFYLDGSGESVAIALKIAEHLGVMAYDTESGDMLTEFSKPPVPPPLDDDELKMGKRKWWQFGKR